MADPTKDRGRVTPEGIKLGLVMAGIADKWAAALAEQGEKDERCKSCAFRAGTVPNGCLQTQMDVMKAVVEDVPFTCHQHDKRGDICHGWFVTQVTTRQAQEARGEPLPVRECPWEFSPPDSVEDVSGRLHD